MFIESEFRTSSVRHFPGIYVFVDMEDILGLCALCKVYRLKVVVVESCCADPNDLCGHC